MKGIFSAIRGSYFWVKYAQCRNRILCEAGCADDARVQEQKQLSNTPSFSKIQNPKPSNIKLQKILFDQKQIYDLQDQL